MTKVASLLIDPFVRFADTRVGAGVPARGQPGAHVRTAAGARGHNLRRALD